MSTDDILVHHGVLGMKWGIRRYQNKDGSLTAEGLRRYGRKNLKNAKTVNMEKWGKDPEHNVAYVTGQSGSGKSTVARSLLKPGDQSIHLDLYSSMAGKREAETLQNKSFNEHLDKNVPRWREMSRTVMSDFSDDISSGMKFGSEEYWNTVDRFRDAIESFGREEYKKGHRVVVEGVQIYDNWLTEDGNFSYFKDKPTVVLGTNPRKSMIRAIIRDNDSGESNISQVIKGFKNKDYVRWYTLSEQRLDNFSTQVEAKKGEKWVKEYFKKSR